MCHDTLPCQGHHFGIDVSETNGWLPCGSLLQKKILYINKPVEMSNNKQSVKEPSLVLQLKSSEVDHPVSTFHGIDV